MKRSRAKATAAAPSGQRLNPVALRTTSAAKDSEAKASFSSGSHSASMSAKDVRIDNARARSIAPMPHCMAQVCVSAKKQKDIKEWLEARKMEGSSPTKRILVLSGPSGEF